MNRADAPDWQVQGADWPLRDASRFVDAGGLRWHVQVLGSGPVLLLLHGTGAATHSWRDIASLLAADYTVVAPDLPGHGFSGPLARERMTLAGIADALAALLRALELEPAFAVGHSAGAAIAAWMALQPGTVIARMAWINAALLPFDGWAGMLFAPLARWMAASPGVARIAAWRAGDRAAVRRLVANTGSTIDARGVDLYQRLVSRPAHVAGALAMMGGWDLGPLQAALPRIEQPVLLIVGQDDRAVPAAQSDAVARRLRTSKVLRLAGAGHLAHEELPGRVATAVLDWFDGRAEPGRLTAPVAGQDGE